MRGKITKTGTSNKKIKEIIGVWRHKNEQIVTDFTGSYTGIGETGDYPVQDADDL